MGRTRLKSSIGLGLALGLALTAGSAGAQQPAAATGPAVGEMAPAFSGRGATRYGRVADPIQVSDYRGKTIVLAFFFRARSSG